MQLHCIVAFSPLYSAGSFLACFLITLDSERPKQESDSAENRHDHDDLMIHHSLVKEELKM